MVHSAAQNDGIIPIMIGGLQATLHTIPKYMENGQTQYMVVFTLPQPLNNDFVSCIPQQRQVVNQLLQEGRILQYSLSMESSQLWVICAADSEAELMELISTLPLTDFMEVRISELTFSHSANAFSPVFSVN